MERPIINSGGAPEWWVAGQRAARARFAALPMPARKDEDWRFANVRELDLAPWAEAVTAGVAAGERERLLADSVAAFDTAGRAVFGNDELLAFDAGVDLAKQGVIFEPLTVALARHSDLLQKYFMTLPVMLGSQKFAALHQARCRDGMLLHVPRGAKVALPLTVWHWLGGMRGAVFPHTLVVADEGSEVTLVEFYRSLDERAGLNVSVADLFVGAGARVNYLCAQAWNENTLSFQLGATSVARAGAAKTLTVNLGGKFVRTESHSRLADPGARSEMLGLCVGHGRQEYDQRTLQDHLAPGTWSDLLYKNVLNHSAKTIFEGLIKVGPGAQQTDAYQTNRNLLLSGDAEADSMPGLEIANDDVKCSHGASTGQIGREELFYLLQRGIPRHEAHRLVAAGFTEEALARFGNEGVSGQLRGMIAEKFRRGKDLQPAVADGEAVDATDARGWQGTL
ncbi:MAG: Fe-S cluster assembly protein SufD [Verrucomicrobiales bacterium]|nr:Fe-S cluster assembly protein SufD [Verrucomicrobiales bacterium]